MQVKTSNVMAKLLKTKLKSLKCIENVYLKQLTANVYSMYCSYNSNPDYDFNYNTGLYNVIVIEYKYNCYAENRFLTTSDLIRCYKKSNGTLEDFIQEVKNEVEI